LTPEEAHGARVRGALLVDTRTEWQRAEQGELPGAIVIDRTVEWRLDPTSPDCIPEVTDAAVMGGVEAWEAAGLPLTAGPADVRR
jgi:rhodanese-related sulfurtransferase